MQESERWYELLMLAVPEITEDESKELEKQLDGTIQKGKGSVISFDRWGKYRLSYPVKKNDYGVYFLARFKANQAEELLDQVKSLFVLKLNTVVMRHVISLLDSKKSLEYQRPRSLEETPAEDVGGLLKKFTRGRSSSRDDRGGAQGFRSEFSKRKPAVDDGQQGQSDQLVDKKIDNNDDE